jgi:hypothetical protein
VAVALCGFGGVDSARRNASSRRRAVSFGLNSDFGALLMAKFLTEFEKFPEEREIVGSLLIAYGEIEFALLGCLNAALDQDMDTSTRILFRVRGESARIGVADAILRPTFAKIGLSGQWGNAIGAVRHCKSIRNQFAHCHWWSDDKEAHLRFLNLDAASDSPEGEVRVNLEPIDLVVLRGQKQYFEYALDWLYFLEDELGKKTGAQRPSRNRVAPKSIPQPPLSSRTETRSPPGPAADTK